MVDVQQRALGALEQHAATGLYEFVQQQPRGTGEGQDLGRDGLQFSQDRSAVHIRQAQAPAQRFVMGQQALDLGLQRLTVRKVGDPDGPATDFILIGRPDAAPGGADLLQRRRFARLVQIAVDRQDEAGVVGQHQQVRGDRYALRTQRGDLLDQVPGIDHHAIADDRQFALHHAGGQQAELIGLIAHHQGVAGVVAALEADHHIRTVGQPVDQLALALIAPLGADHGDIGHGYDLPTCPEDARQPFDRCSAGTRGSVLTAQRSQARRRFRRDGPPPQALSGGG